MPTPPPAPASGLLFDTRPLHRPAPPPAPLPTAPTVPARPDAPPATQLECPPPPVARLVVVRGERPDVAFALLDGKNFIGRTADFAVDIDLDGQERPERTWASRRHAVVSVEGTGAWVEDLHSLNGTFVNRTRLHPGQKVPLRPGDVVQIGTVQLKLLVG